MATIANLAVKLTAETGSFSSKMASAGKDLRDFQDRTSGAISSALKFGGALLGVAVGGGIAEMVHGAIESADQIGDLSKRLGVTSEALTRLQYTSKLNGATTDDLSTAIGTMNRKLGEAARGSNEAAASFDSLGLNFKELINESPDQAFSQIADKIAAIENPALRAAAAAAIFEKGGKAMINVLALGAKGIKDFGSESDRVGATVSGSFVDSMKQTKEAVDRAQSSLSSLARTAASLTAPAVAKAADATSKLLSYITSIAPQSVKFTASVVAFSGTFVTAAIGTAKFIDALTKLNGVLKKIAISETIVDALQGPKGWAVLAGAAIVAAGAVYTLDKAFDNAGATASTQAPKIAQAAVAMQAATAPMIQAANELDEASRRGESSAIQNILGPLIEQTQFFGKSAEQIFQYKLAMSGLDDSTRQYAQSLHNQAAAQQVAQKAMEDSANKQKEIADTLADLRKQVAQSGMNDAQKTLDNLKRNHADGMQIAEATRSLNKLSAADAAQKINDRATSIIDSVKTPLERYQDELAQLNAALARASSIKPRRRYEVAITRRLE